MLNYCEILVFPWNLVLIIHIIGKGKNMAECILLKSGGGTGSDECTATKANVLSGCTAVTKDSDDEAVAGTMANNGAWTSRIGVNGKVIIPTGYHNGSGYVDQAITNRGAVNASLPINGTYTIPEGYHSGAGKVTQNIATMGAQTIAPGNSQKVVSCSGKYMTGNVTVPAVTNLTAANIKKGVNVGGVVGTWEGYVAAATDLYYNGINNAGFTGPKWLSFDSNQITFNTSTTSTTLLTSSRTYNLTGYSQLTIEGDFRLKGLRFALYRGQSSSSEQKISEKSFSLPPASPLILTFNAQITDFLTFQIIGGGNVGSSFTRIRLS